MGYFAYLMYVIKHKFFVCWECWKYGLIWRGVVHDFSKFYPVEFFSYVNYFYGNGGNIHRKRDSSGYYKPTDTGDKAFDFGFFHHIKHNDHHWQYWVLPEDGGKEFKVFAMSDKARKEMLSDWRGAAKAQKTRGVEFWYMKNKNKLVLHENTRKWVEDELKK